MKSFAQFLLESQRSYKYRIKIVGDLHADFLSAFKEQLKQFDPVSVSDIKTTPITSNPVDFPAFENQAVNLIDVEFRYPATPPQIESIARILGVEPARIQTVTQQWALEQEKLAAQCEQPEGALLTSEYPKDSVEQTAANKDYAAVGADKEVIKNSAKSAQWEIAGGAPPPAATTNQLEPGTTSPMTKIKRPPLPAIGINK